MTARDPDCVQCPLAMGRDERPEESRREFIRRAAGLATALGIAALLPREASALAAGPEQRDGSFIDGRATRAMDRLAIRRDGTALVVDLDTLIQQDEHPAEWTAAFVTV